MFQLISSFIFSCIAVLWNIILWMVVPRAISSFSSVGMTCILDLFFLYLIDGIKEASISFFLSIIISSKSLDSNIILLKDNFISIIYSSLDSSSSDGYSFYFGLAGMTCGFLFMYSSLYSDMCNIKQAISSEYRSRS